MPNLQRYVADGWTFEVQWIEAWNKYHACIYRRHRGDSHNHAGKTEMQAIADLEHYVQSQEAREWDKQLG